MVCTDYTIDEATKSPKCLELKQDERITTITTNCDRLRHLSIKRKCLSLICKSVKESLLVFWPSLIQYMTAVLHFKRWKGSTTWLLCVATWLKGWGSDIVGKWIVILGDVLNGDLHACVDMRVGPSSMLFSLVVIIFWRNQGWQSILCLHYLVLSVKQHHQHIKYLTWHWDTSCGCRKKKV